MLIGNVGFAQTNNETNSNVLNNTGNSKNFEVVSPSYDLRSSGYYKKDAADFEQQTKESPSSAQAWLNFYKSSLYSCYGASSKTLSAAQKQELDDIVADMKTKIPGSFEYNIAVYINGQHNTNLLPYLEKASEVNNNHLDVVEQYAAYYAITGNDAKLKEYVIKHRKVSAYESFVEEYAYNLLQSMESNAVLFTHGVMDTYPVYYQQLNGKVNTGVDLINIDYLNSETFRSEISKKYGITFSYYGNNYVAAFEIAEKLKAKRPVYFSNAFSKNELKKHEEKLDLNGLAMKYGEPKTDASKLSVLWTTKFKLDVLQKANMKQDYARKMANNYQPMLITLYQYYQAEKNTKEAASVKAMALKIAAVNGNEKQVSALFN